MDPNLASESAIAWALSDTIPVGWLTDAEGLLSDATPVGWLTDAEGLLTDNFGFGQLYK